MPLENVKGRHLRGKGERARSREVMKILRKWKDDDGWVRRRPAREENYRVHKNARGANKPERGAERPSLSSESVGALAPAISRYQSTGSLFRHNGVLFNGVSSAVGRPSTERRKPPGASEEPRGGNGGGRDA